MARVAPPPITADTRVLALHGPEDVVKKDHVNALKAALAKVHGEVDVYDFDGKAASLADVFDEVRGYSLMGGYKLVVVDPADDFVSTHRAALERYAQNPVDHATLVLRANVWRKGNLDKHIAKVGAVVKCDPPKPAEVVSRLVARAKNLHGMAMAKPAAQLLVDRVGLHLTRLETEVDKLAAMAGGAGQKGIDRALVESAVERGNDEKAWEVQGPILQALISGQSGAALEKVHELIDLGGQPETLVMYFISDLSRKLAVGGRMMASGEGEARVAQALKLWGPQKGLLLRAMKTLGAQGGAKALDRALTTDARSKSGFGTMLRNLEGLCVTLGG
ncbi:MAG: DNA polymerase III subunit delta [Algisphaera sp.]